MPTFLSFPRIVREGVGRGGGGQKDKHAGSTPEIEAFVMVFSVHSRVGHPQSLATSPGLVIPGPSSGHSRKGDNLLRLTTKVLAARQGLQTKVFGVAV